MSKVLLVSTNFFPEPSGIALYTTDLASLLSKENFKVTVLTTLPHYPWWTTPVHLKSYKAGYSKFNEVTVFRIKHYIPKKFGVFNRVRFELSLYINLFFAKKAIDSPFDLVVGVIPTVAAGQIARKIAKCLDVPFYLIIQDLSGVGLKQSGMGNNAGLLQIATNIELKVIRAANSINCISESIAKYVKQNHVTGDIRTIHNYAISKIPILRKDEARRYLELDDEVFLVIHTGNMGKKQALDNLIEAAKLVGHEKNIMILLIGHGNQETRLKELAKDLSNIKILPAASDIDYPYWLNAADLLVINEIKTQVEMSLPSKLTAYLSVKKPILAAVPKNGSTYNYLGDAAYTVEAQDPVAFANAIELLRKDSDLYEQYRKRATKLGRKTLSREVAQRLYLEWLS